MATDRQALRCAKCLKTIRKGQNATTLSFCTYSGRRDGEFIMASWLTIIAHVACMGSLTPEVIREVLAMRPRVVPAPADDRKKEKTSA